MTKVAAQQLQILKTLPRPEIHRLLSIPAFRPPLFCPPSHALQRSFSDGETSKIFFQDSLNSIKGGASALGQSKRTGKFKRSKVTSVFHPNMENASNWLQRNHSRRTAAGNDSEDLNDIDDHEISGYLFHNEKEMELKRILWEMMNKKYLKGKQLKVARKVKKSTPAKKAIKIAGQTENKTRSSSKINYDALKKLLGDGPEEIPGKVEDSKHSNANYADSKLVDENSIPERHSSGASEENDEHEHDYGETDAGNNDYFNDMYFENEEDDYHYAEDYD